VGGKRGRKKASQPKGLRPDFCRGSQRDADKEQTRERDTRDRKDLSLHPLKISRSILQSNWPRGPSCLRGGSNLHFALVEETKIAAFVG
jgi:hypothetical protein